MRPKVNSYEFAKVLQSALKKGQNENQLTVHELLREIASQLEPLIKK
ncbi:hypothetical protein RRV45_11415 [Bacillus sp. DTU_2020_1000418_1_SI_GHA_SEK_038]|nr:hypothetical protein [Bacillus sp. DTU_2020_1000418_1_SI_GHA_SEK_038]WNS73535.1 hypothetical protein RRV45_11415 [Bacillus sp. DTU_2020_1000418_1_SI_GHA_SEK_038]